MKGKRQEITLQNDFDAVVRHGGTTVELNADGSVIMSIGDSHITYANGNLHAQLPNLPVVHNGEARKKIMDLAIEKARSHGNATIGFSHLFAAVLETSPQGIEHILSSEVRLNTLLGLVKKDLSTLPRDLARGAKPKIGPATAKAWRLAETNILGWRTDQLFGAELMHSMLDLRTSRAERSTTIDYIKIIFSKNNELNGPEECRKAIDEYAAATGESLGKLNGQPPDVRPG